MIKKFLSKTPKRKYKDALRIATQSAVSAAATYAILTGFGLPQVFVGVLSAVLVVESSIGNTLEQSKGRVSATVVGSIIGFICATLIPYGAATAISLAIAMFIMNAISTFRPSWRYGVVAAVAIALGSPDNAIDMSIDRIISIFIGITIGILSSLIFWPEKASSRANKHFRQALRVASERFTNALENTRTSGADDEETSVKFHNQLSNARDALKSIKIEDVSQLRLQIDNVEKLYNSILIIHRVAAHSEKGVSDGKAGIKNDAERVRELACEITQSLADNEAIGKEKLDEFSSCVNQVRSNIHLSESDSDINILRNALLFGLAEVESAILDLCDNTLDIKN